jgi:hypothetical protein
MGKILKGVKTGGRAEGPAFDGSADLGLRIGESEKVT